MRWTAAAAALCFAATSGSAQVTGRVLDARSESGVEGAAVWLIGDGAEHRTVSAVDGSYVIRDVVPAEYTLLVMHPGYDAVRIRVTVGARALTVELPLEPRPVPMPQLVVQTDRRTGSTPVAESSHAAAAADPASRRFDRIGPQSAGALGDLVLAETAREPPPDAPGSRRPHVLYIWGSSAERGRVLLDGATLNAPLHLGGILPPLDPELLGRAELRTGGVSPRYDGGTTYIMDFATRAAPSHSLRSHGEVDLLATRAGAGVPLGAGAGLQVGARRVNHELVRAALGRPFGYSYADALGRLDVHGGVPGLLTLSGVVTHEAIRLPRDLGEDQAAWRNAAAALNWRPGGEAGGLHAHASFSRGEAELPLLTALEGRLNATVDRIAAAAENRWAGEHAVVRAGGDFEHLRFARRSSAASDPAAPGGTGPVACTPSLPCASAGASRLAVFAEAAWQPADRVSARAGLRAAQQPGGARISLLPRLALTLVNRAGTTSATVSAGRFSQVTADAAAAPALAMASVAAAGGNAGLATAIAHATQFEVQLTHRAARATLAASAFLRRHEAGAGFALLTAPGADLSIGYAGPSARFALGYSVLARRASPAGDSIRYQHLAATTLGATHGRFDFTVTTAYGAGLPLTSIVLERPVVTTTTPGETGGGLDRRAYFRIDGLLSARWTVNARGRPMTIMPYARLVNGLSRREALFYFQDGGTPGEPQPVAALSALPVLGVRWAF